MLTDSDLLQRLHDVLRTSDLDTATAATVRRRLEQELGIDLSDRKPYIRQQIDLYLQSHYTDGNPEGEVEESENVKVEESDDGGSVSKEAEDDPEEEESDAEEKKIDSKRNKTGEPVHFLPNKTASAKKRGGGGFSKPCALSPQLQKFTGEPEMARTEVVKKIWVYIKEKDLQNPKNKRKILCDEMLHEIFRVKSIDMFQMNKALSKHIWPIEEEDVTVKPSVKNQQNKRVKEATVEPSDKKKQNKRVKEDEHEPKQKEKAKKTKGSGFVSPLPISDKLAQFFGTGESELSRSEVVKRMWDYIKQNDLQDPKDKRRILCDDKLKELFKVKSFIGFTVSKLLTAHFIKEKE
ncbi:hypothetical protein L1987_31842 [Smallanthus sonchifolius]|uniref:Uncharacterized protein n=1 Tax=Smallanthus sonchifolius TaxID=185202 RepID=A0ACB9I9D8_9ASTR|nr:hypothetical protein L1987_31842 [Smallanthus sonchifolius]